MTQVSARFLLIHQQPRFIRAAVICGAHPLLADHTDLLLTHKIPRDPAIVIDRSNILLVCRITVSTVLLAEAT